MLFFEIVRAMIVLLALPFLSVASPVANTLVSRTEPGNTSICNGSPVQCCQQLQSSNTGLNGLTSILVGLLLPSLTGQVGVNCSPLTIIGVSGTSCTGQTVCCQGNNIGGGLSLVSVGCTPINVNL